MNGVRTLRVSAATWLVLTAAAWLILMLLSPQPAVRIKLRWKPGIDESHRVELERRFHLSQLSFDEGTTWTYRLDDPSVPNIRSLVQDGAVDDTAHLNRTRFRPEFRQDAGRLRPIYATVIGAIGALAAFWWGRRRTSRPAPGTAAMPAVPVSANPARPAVALVSAVPADAAPASAASADLGPVDTAPLPEHPFRWTLLVLVATLPLLIPLCLTMWRTPYPISETVSLLEDVRVTTHSFFDPTARTWYRPLYFLTWSVFWQRTGSLESALLLFRLLGIGAAGGLVLLFIRLLRPRTILDGAAATVAVAVLVGSPAFRTNLELPLFMTLVGMPLILLVWMLTEHTPRAWHAPVMVALMLAATGFKEQGLVIVPLVMAAWWAGAPGVTRRAAVAVVAAGSVYLVVRFASNGGWHAFEQSVGFGFVVLSPNEAMARFGHALWAIRGVQVAATASNLLFSEPTDGQFRFVSNLVRGVMHPWQVNMVVSSTALTALIAAWGIGVIRRDRWHAWTLESRVFVAAVVTVGASGALGFSYARDRLGGMAVVFVALAAYFAMRRAGDAVMRLRGALLPMALTALVVLAAAWQVRAVGTLEAVRVQSEKNQREWIVDLFARHRDFADRRVYIEILDSMTAQGVAPSAPHSSEYPDWVRSLLGED